MKKNATRQCSNLATLRLTKAQLWRVIFVGQPAGSSGPCPIQPPYRPPPSPSSLSLSLSLSPPIQGHHQVDGGNEWEKEQEGRRKRAAGLQWKEGGRPTMKPQLTRRKRAKRIARLTKESNFSSFILPRAGGGVSAPHYLIG